MRGCGTEFERVGGRRQSVQSCRKNQTRKGFAAMKAPSTPDGQPAKRNTSSPLAADLFLPVANLLHHSRTLPDPRSVHEHPPCPAIHVKFLHCAAHAEHASALFGEWHGECQMQCSGALIDVIGVHDE